MSKGFDFLVSSLERRYDHHSARIMGREALDAAGLEEKKEYTDQEIQQLVDALASIGDGDLDKVWRSLGSAPAGTELPAADEAAEEASDKADKAAEKAEKKASDKAEAEADKAEKKDDEAKKDDKKSSSKSGGSKKK